MSSQASDLAQVYSKLTTCHPKFATTVCSTLREIDCSSPLKLTEQQMQDALLTWKRGLESLGEDDIPR